MCVRFKLCVMLLNQIQNIYLIVNQIMIIISIVKLLPEFIEYLFTLSHQT